MTKIITSQDIAQRDGAGNARAWIKARSIEMIRRGKLSKPWDGSIKGQAIPARIDFGRWIADCPYCGGAEYIDPDDPFFFCLSCGMEDNQGAALPLIIPPDREAIEALVLARPIRERRITNMIQAAFTAAPVYPGLSRSWHFEETVDDLKQQNQAIKAKIS